MRKDNIYKNVKTWKRLFLLWYMLNFCFPLWFLFENDSYQHDRALL